MSSTLGKLERVDLRTVWANEANDFTPWLATEENLALLGDTINMDLELEAQEQHVGPFRADILCKDITSGDWVVIENQLNRTDHSHLGQILTYAAGLKAATIVWIADEFTDQHRAAVDWLNEITDARFGFFGLEMDLWKIDASPPAPRFNIVCKPNDWSRELTAGAHSARTETEQLYWEYWDSFCRDWEASDSRIRCGKAKPQNWTAFALGRSNFLITASISKNKRTAHVQLVLYGDDRIAHLRLLESQRVEIEKNLGSELEWRELPNRKESQIRLTFSECDPSERDNWPSQHRRLRETIEGFHAVFSPRVRRLDAADYEPESAPDDL